MSVDGGTAIQATPDPQVGWSQWAAEVNLSVPDSHSLSLTAADTAGNQATTAFMIQSVSGTGNIDETEHRLMLVEITACRLILEHTELVGRLRRFPCSQAKRRGLASSHTQEAQKRRLGHRVFSDRSRRQVKMTSKTR